MTKKIDKLNHYIYTGYHTEYNKDMSKKHIASKGTPKIPHKNAGSKTALPKRRGRRPKKVINEDNDFMEDDMIKKSEDTSIILRMKIDPSKLHNFDMRSSSTNKIINDEDESSEGMFKNDIPKDVICKKCTKNEKIITSLKMKMEKYEQKENIIKTNKIHVSKLDIVSFPTGGRLQKKKNIWCLWDGHPFVDEPFRLPEMFHKGKYYVTGYFCSPNCALAHNLYYLKDSKVHQRKTLVFNMYREMLGFDINDAIELKEAPPREILVNFGGDNSIESFRQSFSTINREYIVFIPPIKCILPIIEERIAGLNGS